MITVLYLSAFHFLHVNAQMIWNTIRSHLRAYIFSFNDSFHEYKIYIPSQGIIFLLKFD